MLWHRLIVTFVSSSRRFDTKSIPPSPKPARSLHNLFSSSTLGRKNPFSGMLSDDGIAKVPNRQRRNTQPHQESSTEKPATEQRKRLHRLSMPVLEIGPIGFDKKSINFSLRRRDVSNWKEMSSPTSSMMSPPISPSAPTSPAPARSKSGRSTHLITDMFFPSVPPTPKPSIGTGYITPPSSHGSSANEIAIPPLNAPETTSESSGKSSSKIPWLQNLFFFKQPKVFSVSCEAIDCHQALRKMQDAMREVSIVFLLSFKVHILHWSTWSLTWVIRAWTLNFKVVLSEMVIHVTEAKFAWYTVSIHTVAKETEKETQRTSAHNVS